MFVSLYEASKDGILRCEDEACGLGCVDIWESLINLLIMVGASRVVNKNCELSVLSKRCTISHITTRPRMQSRLSSHYCWYLCSVTIHYFRELVGFIVMLCSGVGMILKGSRCQSILCRVLRSACANLHPENL
jgi:hypothetical protein